LLSEKTIKEKRIEELRTLIHVQNVIMESISQRRGEYLIELCKLEAKQIEAEAELEYLEVKA
jgi:hypothetical protein